MTTHTPRTLVFPVQGDRVWLGTATNKHGKVMDNGTVNGFGGKVEDDESLLAAACRELREESGLVASPRELEKVAEMTFAFPHKPAWNQVVHTYLVRTWNGEPVKTKEMHPQLFRTDEIPYERMFDADKYWLPLVLEGKYVKGSVVYNEDKRVTQMDFEKPEGYAPQIIK